MGCAAVGWWRWVCVCTAAHQSSKRPNDQEPADRIFLLISISLMLAEAVPLQIEFAIVSYRPEAKANLLSVAHDACVSVVAACARRPNEKWFI